MKKTGKKKEKSFPFTLKNINVQHINQKYGLTIDDKIPLNSTKLEDIVLEKKKPEVISFLDESKKLVKCNISMIDFRNFTKIL